MIERGGGTRMARNTMNALISVDDDDDTTARIGFYAAEHEYKQSRTTLTYTCIDALYVVDIVDDGRVETVGASSAEPWLVWNSDVCV